MTTGFKLSLYQPTFRQQPDKQQNLPRYRNLIRSFENTLEKIISREEVEVILAPFRQLALDADFWSHPLDGLAILSDHNQFDIYRLPRPVPELAVVAHSFHIKPLLRIRQSAYRFHVLALTRRDVKLFEGDRDGLMEIPLHKGVPRTIEEALGSEQEEPHVTVARSEGSYGGNIMRHTHRTRQEDISIDTERFFRVVDNAITEYHSKASGLPIITAALPEHEAVFQSISHNPYLMTVGVGIHPSSIDSHAFMERVRSVIMPFISERLNRIRNVFSDSAARDRGSDDVKVVGKAALDGRIQLLMVDADRIIPGELVDGKGIEFYDASAQDIDDVLDDIAEIVLEKGGEVLVVPSSDMPTASGIAAVYRW
jgi:hypothetical protein